jgi:putative ABC transport system permease protein
MNNHIINISLISMIFCYGLAGIIISLFYVLKIGLSKELIISVSRMTVQLVLASYLLKYIFNVNNVYLILLMFVVMSAFASNIIFKKSKAGIKELRFVLFPIVFIIGLLLSLFLLLIITKVTPWYNARYFIPMAGMILGNSMNACALALDRFTSDVKGNFKAVETILSMGGTPYEACSMYIKKAMRNAALPFIASMNGIGIVFIPGMMTGQLLSGTDPLVAFKYQIAMMMSIASSVVFTSLLSLYFAHKFLFDEYGRLKYSFETK